MFLCSWVRASWINVNNCPKYATVYSLLYFRKLPYVFWVVTPPIIRSRYKCNYSIWHWSTISATFHYSSNFSTVVEGSRDGLISTRCCNYSYMCSWWWVELQPETCRAVYRNTGLLQMTVGVLTTCHTQYTWDRSTQLHRWIKKFSKFSFMMGGVQ